MPLDDFTFMKTYRILGILWLALCCYFSFNEVRALLMFHPANPSQDIVWFVFGIYCLVYLTGIVASIFLFRGAFWARWAVGLVISIQVVTNIAFVVRYGSFSVAGSIFYLFALTSLVLLFLPRHEPVA